MRLTDRVARYWAIDYLIERGIAVEYWNVLPLLFGYDETASKKTNYLCTLSTYRELEKKLQLPENIGASYIMLFSYQSRTLKLYRLMSKYDCRMFYISWGLLAINHARERRAIFGRLFSEVDRLPIKIYYKLKEIIYSRLETVKPYDVVFAAGKKSIQSNYFATKIVPVNYIDYEVYNQEKLIKERIVKEEYAVFLDNNLPYHTDMKIVGWKSIDPDKYYSQLNVFFGLVEKKYNIKVVVAAHPQANYDSGVFQSREVYYGKTSSLVKDSNFVISHNSTSISFAVLNFKSIIFIMTDEMRSIYKDTLVSHIYDFADYLGVSSIYNIDDIDDVAQIKLDKPDRIKYKKYIRDFLATRESEKSDSQEIIFQEVCRFK